MRGNHVHGEEVREAAYDTWVELGQSTARTAEHLDIPASTIRYWMRTDGWKARHAIEVFPVRRNEAYDMIRRNVIAAGIHASEKYRRHHDPDDDYTITDRIELEATHGALDRVGFAAVRVINAPPIEEELPAQPVQAPTLPDFATMTPQQIRAAEQGRPIPPVTSSRSDAIEVEVHVSR